MVFRFMEQVAIFVQKNKTTMKHSDSFLPAFSRLLEQCSPLPDFPDCCRRLGIPPGILNEILLDEFGLCGEEFVLLTGV